MFIILGGDGKEYGPASGEQVKEWIKQGRVDESTKVKREGEADWKKASDFPELVPPAPPAAPPITAESPSDYSIEIGDYVKRGWNLVIQNPFATILAAIMIALAVLALNVPSWVGNLIASAAGEGSVGIKALSALLGFVSGVLSILFHGVLYGGFYYFMLRIMREENPEVLTVFDGFKRNFVQLVLGGVVMSLLIGLGIILCILPGIYLAVSYVFALPLIIDKQLGFWDAMELSRKTVGKHFWWMLLFVILVGIIAAVGAIACGVGVFFTIPIASAALLYAYEDIFKKP